MLDKWIPVYSLSSWLLVSCTCFSRIQSCRISCGALSRRVSSNCRDLFKIHPNFSPMQSKAFFDLWELISYLFFSSLTDAEFPRYPGYTPNTILPLQTTKVHCPPWRYLNIAIWNEVNRSNICSAIQWEQVDKYKPYSARPFKDMGRK